MPNARIKIVLKYIPVLVGLPILCSLMIALFLALFLHTGLLDIGFPKYTHLMYYIVLVVPCAVSGFIMGLLISSLAKNREIMMTLFGVLTVTIIYVGTYVYYSNSTIETTGYNMLMARDGILLLGLLLGFALMGAWLVVKKRRSRVQKEVQT